MSGKSIWTKAFPEQVKETKADRLKRERHIGYLRLKKQFFSTRKVCELCGKEKPLDLHHIVPRSLRQDLIMVEDNWLAVCRFPCHTWIHEHPKLAQIKGYLSKGNREDSLQKAATRRRISQLEARR